MAKKPKTPSPKAGEPAAKRPSVSSDKKPITSPPASPPTAGKTATKNPATSTEGDYQTLAATLDAGKSISRRAWPDHRIVKTDDGLLYKIMDGDRKDIYELTPEDMAATDWYNP